jgi:hypothetical protein
MRAFVCALILAASPAIGAERLAGVRPERWALGLMLGDPFGISLKHYNRSPTRYPPGANAYAWDVYAALAYGPGVRFGGDWIWVLDRLVAERKFDLDLHAGVGPFIGALSEPCGPGFLRDRCNGDVYFGARVPLGVELLLREAPVTFGLELAPGIGFAPGRAGLLLDFFLALRWVL